MKMSATVLSNMFDGRSSDQSVSYIFTEVTPSMLIPLLSPHGILTATKRLWRVAGFNEMDIDKTETSIKKTADIFRRHKPTITKIEVMDSNESAFQIVMLNVYSFIKFGKR